MSSPPLAPTADTSFYPGASAGVAELKLAYAFDQGLEVAILIGEPGLGKTTLLRRLTARVMASGHVAADVFFPRLDADGLLAFVDAELSAEPSPDSSREIRLRRIAQRARRLAEDGRRIAIVIDDAHLIRDAEVFEALHLLCNLREREGVCLTIILAGQRSLLAGLARVRAFAQRVAVTAALFPLNAEETADYIRHRLRFEGRDECLLETETLTAIHDRSDGVPRAIDRIREMATLVASSQGRSGITTEDVAAVAAEFSPFDRQAA